MKIKIVYFLISFSLSTFYIWLFSILSLAFAIFCKGNDLDRHRSNVNGYPKRIFPFLFLHLRFNGCENKKNEIRENSRGIHSQV